MNELSPTESIQELLVSEGWKMVVHKLADRKAAAMNELLTTSERDAILRAQVRVQEVNVLMDLPKAILRSEQLTNKEAM